MFRDSVQYWGFYTEVLDLPRNVSSQIHLVETAGLNQPGLEKIED